MPIEKPPRQAHILATKSPSSIFGPQTNSKDKRTFFLLITIGIVVSMTGFPTALWRDSWFYLANAQSIFSDDMQSFYYWVREPGYPLLIRLVTEIFGKQDLTLVVIQSVMMSLAILIVVKYGSFQGESKRPRFVKSAILIGIFTSQYFGYSATLLKQPLLVFLSALTVVAIRYIQSRRGRPITTWLGTMMIVFFSSFISISLSYTWVIVGVLTVIYTICLPNRDGEVPLTSVRKLGKIIVYSILTVFLSFQVIGSGRSILSSYEVRVTGVVSDKTRLVETSSSGAIGRMISKPASEIAEALQNVGSLTMLGPTDNFEGVKENNVFSAAQLESRWICGLYDDYNPDPWTERFIEYGRYLETSCRSPLAQNLLRAIHPYTYRIYQLSMISMFLYVPLILFKRRFHDLALFAPAIWFLTLFSFGVRYTNDRYGLVLFPFGLLALSQIVDSARKLIPAKEKV